MVLPEVHTDPAEFWKFHKLITAGSDYQPFYFPLEREGKEPRAGISWKNNRKTFNEAYYLMKGASISVLLALIKTFSV